MKHVLLAAAVITISNLIAVSASATTVSFSFAAPGVGGFVNLAYGTTTDARYGSAFEVTNIGGTFSDATAGIVDAPILALVSPNFVSPERTNLLAPSSFSKIAVATGLPPETNGFVTYDDLYWPEGSLPTATDYPVGGGFLDIYGLLFSISNGRFVNLWSNGDSGNGVDYGVSVSTASQSLDYVSGGIAVPEPMSFGLLATAATLAFGVRRLWVKRT